MRKLTLSLAILAALLPGQGQTLGLGEIELKSALNQELDAEIEVLSAVPEDAEQLIVKLASRDAFSRAGIDRPFMLQQLKFKVYVKDDKPYVKVFTKSAVKEPFLSFLVEIDWPEGHMLREYTLLLDPPVYSGVEGSRSGRPADEDGGRPFIDPADQTAAQPVYSQQASGRPVQAQQAMQTQPAVVESYSAGGEVTYRAMPQAQQVSGSYRVKQSDTLWSMANRFRPDSSVSVEQMMLALVRENPEAFIQENIHGVKRGYILRMPDKASITSVDRQQAIAQVREHAALWREYRQSQTGAAPASAMESEQSAMAPEQETMEADGKLSIVSASQAEGSEADVAGQDPAAEVSRLRSQLAMARESLESERLEKENLRTRLNDLEERVTRVLEMDDTELAKLQQDLQGTKQDIEAAAEIAEPELVEDVVPDTAETETAETMETEAAVAAEEELAEPGIVELPAEPGAEEVVTEDAAEMPSTEEAPAAEGEEPLFVDETVVPEEAAEVTEAAPAPVMPETEAPAFVQTKPKSFIEKLMDQPSMLAIIGGVLLAVIAAIALVLRGKRKKSGEDEWIADESEEASAFDEGDTGQMEALDETMKLSSEELQSDSSADEAEAAFDENLEERLNDLAAEDNEASAEETEQDDVLAEADVYLAYGIYQQAEDLLNNAISSNPDRDDYRMKLLETHFAAKNADGFASLAEEVKGRKADDKSYWDRVVLMGNELCPGNALFEAGDLDVSAMDTDDLIPQKPETTDLELDAGDESDSDATQILSEPLDLDSPVVESDTGSMDDLSDDLSGFDELSMDEAPVEEDDLAMGDDLEFNLGDLEDSEAAATDIDEDASLDLEDDFALDLEASDLGLEEAVETAEADSEADEEMDLSMDLDVGEESSDDTSLDLDSDEELDLSMDLDAGGDDLSMDLDVGEETADDASLDLADDEELDLSMDMDVSDSGSDEISIDTGDDEISMDTGDDEIALDMDDTGDVELEMSMDDSADDAEISLDAGDDDFDISSLSEDVDEVGTKLELARAYLEMGDKEGARSILDEVKLEGNDEQQKEAEELLQQAS